MALSDYKLGPAEVEGMIDVIKALQEQSDSATLDEGIEMRLVVERAAQQLRILLDLINHQLLTTLEGETVIRDGKKFYVGKKTDRERYDHDRIARFILRQSTAPDEETGELPHPADAVRGAIDAFSDIYLSDSTKAKVGQLDKHSIPRNHWDPLTVRHIEQGAAEVKCVPAGGETWATTPVRSP